MAPDNFYQTAFKNKQGYPRADDIDGLEDEWGPFISKDSAKVMEDNEVSVGTPNAISQGKSILYAVFRRGRRGRRGCYGIGVAGQPPQMSVDTGPQVPSSHSPLSQS